MKTIDSKLIPLLLTVYRVLTILGFLVLLGGALIVPFYYETQTLWYKIGTDKILLRAGQLAGMLALVLVLTQIFLALRTKFAEKLFGSATLMRWHRINGWLIFSAAATHALLILAPEGFSNLPIGIKYWPEMIGGCLSVLIFSTVILSHFRALLRLNYPTWRLLHKPLGYMVPPLVLLHVSFVCETFRNHIPAIILTVVSSALLLLAIKTNYMKTSNKGVRGK